LGKAVNRTQKSFIYSKEKLLVNFVGRFENLEKDFQTVCIKIGVTASLPKINVSSHESYQKYYNDETIEIVNDVFKQDVFTFGYVYE